MWSEGLPLGGDATMCLVNHSLAWRCIPCLPSAKSQTEIELGVTHEVMSVSLFFTCGVFFIYSPNPLKIKLEKDLIVLGSDGDFLPCFGQAGKAGESASLKGLGEEGGQCLGLPTLWEGRGPSGLSLWNRGREAWSCCSAGRRAWREEEVGLRLVVGAGALG